MVTRVFLAILLLAPAAPARAQRLPAGVVPIHYDISVTPDLAAGTFTGEETIRVRLDRPSPAIVLNAAEFTFTDVRITAGGTTQTARVSLDAGKEQATFRVPRPIPAGDAEIAIRYDGILNRDLRGLYLSEANNRRYAVTQLEATDARRMFPSFDEPAFKATYALKATIDAGDHAISNGAVVADTPGPGAGKHTLEFETTPKMSTYLVALAVGDFECSGGTADGIPVRICATPGKKALTGFALEATKEIVQYFNRYYSIPYPFKKLDIVAVPDFAAGAMENTGAIFYREVLLLADANASVPVRKSIAEVLAHEIAHQWFGNLVTMQWWDDIWLNEGFANWAMSKPLKAWRPDWHVELDEIENNHLAMGLDALRSTRPVRARATTTAEIAELFDPIAYEKGAAVLRMIEAWVGEAPFQKAVNAYLEKFQYGNARAEDFWTTLARSTGKPVDEVMPTFVDQPGLPLVSIDLRCSEATPYVVVSQSRYLRDPSPPAAAGAGSAMTTKGAAVKDDAPLWQIPVCLRTSTGQTRCEVVKEAREAITLDACPAWVMANATGRNYYRAAAPPAMVARLAAEIGKLTPAERMVVLSDELALVRAGRHDVGAVLDLAAGFGAERTADVVGTLASVLAAVGGDLATGEAADPYRRWVARLVAPAWDAVGGMASRPSDSDDTKALRATLAKLLGRTARDPAVLASARELVQAELEKKGSVDPTLLNVVVELAAIGGDAALYDRYLARGQAATDPEERYQYLFALTQFTDPALVRRTMELALSPAVRSQDTKLVVANLLINNDRRVVWPLVREHWSEIQKKTGEFVGNVVIVGALAATCDGAQADEIEKFFAAHEVPDAERTLRQSLEAIRSCSRYVEAQRPKLVERLKN
jgi:aminopeptidase N